MFAGPDPDNIFKLRDKDLTVADLAGFGLFQDCHDYLLRDAVCHHHFNLHFRNEGDIYLHPVKDLDMPFLPAEPFCFRSHGHSMDADGDQGILDRIKLERFYDRLDLYHDIPYLRVFVMLKSG
jgi:hypothetical protein